MRLNNKLKGKFMGWNHAIRSADEKLVIYRLLTEQPELAHNLPEFQRQVSEKMAEMNRVDSSYFLG